MTRYAMVASSSGTFLVPEGEVKSVLDALPARGVDHLAWVDVDYDGDGNVRPVADLRDWRAEVRLLTTVTGGPIRRYSVPVPCRWQSRRGGAS